MDELYSLPGCRLRRVRPSGSTAIIVAAPARPAGVRCPSCGVKSRAVHGRYTRSPADLPSLGQAVRLELHVRRFSCRNGGCGRQTFAERVPGLIRAHARRTRRLAAVQSTIGVAVGGEAGARLLAHLAMPASADTLLRLVRWVPLPARQTPRALGVDDWALTKGRTYGTILVDLGERRVVDLLPDRAAATLARWLRRHRAIEVIARDRSTEYARGATAGAPAATQVADRWHLLLNVRQMAERWCVGAYARLKHLPPVVPADVTPARRRAAYPRTQVEVTASTETRARRAAAYEEVRRLYTAGARLLAISRTTGLARATVRKYAYAKTFPERAVRVPAASILDPYLAHLEARLAAECENAMALWRELRQRGFGGTARQVLRWLRDRRTVPAKTTPRRYRPSSSTGPTAAGSRTPMPPTLPSPKQLAWILIRPPASLAASEVALTARVEQDPDAARVIALVRRFVALVRDRAAEAGAAAAALDRWLADALASGVRAVETFAAGLQQDHAAVRAALTTPWSDGQAEGHITRVKLVKRQMYGRAKFDLLRRRVLLAA